MVMANNFGPLTAGRYTFSSTSQSIDPELFMRSWKAQGSSGEGKVALAEYKILPPTGDRAYFHMLLDASGSTWQRVKSGDKKRVYKHLFLHFADVVVTGDTFRPQDMIFVWSFNKRTTLLCAVERRHFPAKLNFIRAQYKEELDGENYKETRLYDAVAAVMDSIRETYRQHPDADFFLVPFTDGVDNGSIVVTLDGMMQRTNSLMGRLHTFFITVNLPRDSALLRRLAAQQSEITHHDCESAEPVELARAFDKLRECVKAYLVVLADPSGDARQLTRIADYGRSEQEVAHRMMLSLSQQMLKASLMGSLGPA